MSLPNYAPQGQILFGCVPWDNSYKNVRLYASISEQYSDISSMMTINSNPSNYVYIGRNRRLKVNIESDRLYHCNYCMYRNDSLTDGYIYCFISDIKYINDHTSEVLLETDIFQTYLYGIDWEIPPCFIERETVPSEDSRYMFTSEPNFPLIYVVDGVSDNWFRAGGYVIMTCSEPKQNGSIIDAVLNPSGWYTEPAPLHPYKGIPNGCNFYYCPISTSSYGSEQLETFLNEITWAGSVDSVVAIFTIPDFATQLFSGAGFPQQLDGQQDSQNTVQKSFSAPDWGATLNGYAPKNRKLLYFPYTYCNLSDYNGSEIQLRYEFMGSTVIDIKYILTPSCEAYVFCPSYSAYPYSFDNGFVTKCGALGSWVNNAYANYMGQNAASIAITAAGIGLTLAAGGVSLGTASAALTGASKMAGAGARHFDYAATMGEAGILSNTGMEQLASGAQGAINLASQQSYQSKQPGTVKGQADYDLMFGIGLQGIHAQRVTLKSEVAEQIDEFFSRWGYEVDQIEPVNITSRAHWNYVKTQGAAARSANGVAGMSMAFSRGRGTPSEALKVINSCFDSGVTFWHDSSTFGDFGQDNYIV